MKNSKINDGHYLELMDRLHVIMSNINDHCLNHPLSKSDKDIKIGIEYALGQIWDVYQNVGRKEYEKTNKENGIHKVIFRRHKKPKN